MAPMLSASVMPLPAPRAAASMMLTSSASTSIVTSPAVLDSSVSGMSNFAITNEAGAAMTLAVSRYSARTPSAM